jgi:hypothetical protein
MCSLFAPPGTVFYGLELTAGGYSGSRLRLPRFSVSGMKPAIPADLATIESGLFLRIGRDGYGRGRMDKD